MLVCGTAGGGQTRLGLRICHPEEAWRLVKTQVGGVARLGLGTGCGI